MPVLRFHTVGGDKNKPAQWMLKACANTQVSRTAVTRPYVTEGTLTFTAEGAQSDILKLSLFKSGLELEIILLRQSWGWVYDLQISAK